MMRENTGKNRWGKSGERLGSDVGGAHNRGKKLRRVYRCYGAHRGEMLGVHNRGEMSGA